jgi:hypothetical protein
VEAVELSIDDVSMLRTATFDSSSWNISNKNYSTIAIYSGISGGNIAQPPWIGTDFVAEPFELLPNYTAPPNFTYAAKTRSIFPKLTCEAAKLVRRGRLVVDAKTHYARPSMTFVSKSCQEVEVAQSLGATDPSSKYEGTIFSNETYVGGVHPVTCANETAFLVVVTLSRGEDQEPANYRYVATCGRRKVLMIATVH